MNDRVPNVSPDLPSLSWRATLALLERLPQAALSRSFGRIADLRIPPALRNTILGGFARAVGIDLSEAERPVSDYASLNEFFARKLRPGARDFPRTAGIAVSPVDGIIGQHGAITKGRLIQAKGRDYSANYLLADVEEARRYDEGVFITLYLSPRHYHRIHAPCSGNITGARYVPGALLPVNAAAVQHVPHLFPRNERVSCLIDSDIGRCAVVAVGAYNVGRISTTFDSAWAGPEQSVSNRHTHGSERHYDAPLPVTQGDEIMAFHLGSTVVLLFERGVRITAPAPGTEVRIGTELLRR